MLNNIFTKKANVSKPITFTPVAESIDSFSETDLLEFMLVQEMAISETMINHSRYTYIGEKDDCLEIVRESVSDFFDKMVEFFRNLLKKIKEFFGKLFLLIQSLMGKTKNLIENNKAAILKKHASFVVEDYKYTIPSSSPNLKYLENLVSTYNREYDKISKMKMDEIKERREEAMETLPKLRGEILGTNTRIEDGELRSEADKFFRDGDDEAQSITVDNVYISKICDEYSNLDKTYTECVKQKRMLEVQLEGLKKYFETGSRQVKYVNGEARANINKVELKDAGVVRTGDSYSPTATGGTLKTINAYFDYRFAESKELSNIVLTVVDAKCRALKDQVKHYDYCIRKWIYAEPESNKGKDDSNDNKNSAN